MNDDGHGLGQELKKRRIQRACDICRRKKSECPGNIPGLEAQGEFC